MKVPWLDGTKKIYFIVGMALLFAGCAQGQRNTGLLAESYPSPASQQTMISEEHALKIASNLDQVKAVYSIGNNRFADCIETSVVPACESDWVTCVEDAWVIKYGLNVTCPTKADERFGVTLVMDSKTGEIISEYPEIEYFKDAHYCRDDNDCYCYLDGKFPPEVVCVNFVIAPLVGVGFKPCAGCTCHEDSCIPTRKLLKE